jgi:hypothetical protein
VQFIELTAARQLDGGGIVWPSRVYVAELLAWDVFLGLASACRRRGVCRCAACGVVPAGAAVLAS